MGREVVAVIGAYLWVGGSLGVDRCGWVVWCGLVVVDVVVVCSFVFVCVGVGLGGGSGGGGGGGMVGSVVRGVDGTMMPFLGES